MEHPKILETGGQKRADDSPDDGQSCTFPPFVKWIKIDFQTDAQKIPLLLYKSRAVKFSSGFPPFVKGDFQTVKDNSPAPLYKRQGC